MIFCEKKKYERARHFLLLCHEKNVVGMANGQWYLEEEEGVCALEIDPSDELEAEHNSKSSL